MKKGGQIDISVKPFDQLKAPQEGVGCVASELELNKYVPQE